jgi:GNAT superfamily N-acetyltransferase
VIRPAKPSDVPAILGFIRELAEYEKLLDQAVGTEEQIAEHLFGPRTYAESLLVVEVDGPTGEETPVGFCLFFTNYSTFLTKPGLYLEDLYVTPSARGRGHGKAMMVALAALAAERGYGRFEWSVLDWNKPSRDFYESLGAEPMTDWIIHRLSGPALQKVAQLGQE